MLRVELWHLAPGATNQKVTCDTSKGVNKLYMHQVALFPGIRFRNVPITIMLIAMNMKSVRKCLN